MSAPASWKIKLGLIAFGLLIGAIASEAALRILDAGRQGRTEFESIDDLRRAMLSTEGTHTSGSLPLKAIITPHSEDTIIYDLQPNLNVTFQWEPLQTNSCGMRSAERAIAKPYDTFRIALLGDSFAFGWGVKQNESFAQVLEDNLNRTAGPNQNFEVLNLGVPGYSTYQEVAKFKEIGLDFKPDAVIVFFVSNDFGFPFFVRDLGQPGGLWSATHFAKLSWKAAQPDVEAERLRLLGLDPNTALRELSDLTAEQGIRLFLAFNTRSDWTQDRDRLPILRERKNIEQMVLRRDFMRLYRERGYKESELSLANDPHPSALRHKMLGELMTPYFMEFIL